MASGIIRNLPASVFTQLQCEGTLKVGDYCSEVWYLPGDRPSGHHYTVLMVEPELVVEGIPYSYDEGRVLYRWEAGRTAPPFEGLANAWVRITEDEYIILKLTHEELA